MMSRHFPSHRMKVPCPNPTCDHPIDPDGSGSLSFCHGCACPLLYCPACRVANHLWAAFCRACGREIIGRRDFAARDAETLLHLNGAPRNLNTEERGLEPAPFLEIDMEIPPGSKWSGKLAPVDGSVLVFAKEAGEMGYSNLFLVHPHMGPSAVSLHKEFSELHDSKLSGASVVSDKYLYLGSDRRLYRLDLSSISPLMPYRPNMHIHDYDAASDDIIFLSPQLLLLKNIKDQCFSLWDVGEKCMIGPRADAEARYFTVKDDWLFAAGDSGIAVFRIEHARKEIKGVVQLPSPGGTPAAPPVFVHERLLLLLSSPSGERSLYKWELETGERFSDPKPVNTESVDRLTGLRDRYGLLRFGGSYFYDPVSDSLLSQFPAMFGLDLETEPGSSGSLLAVPTKNTIASKSISVVNALSGQYVFTTGPFSQFAAGPALWGRWLFVLGQRLRDPSARLYVYELKG
jgi:hypothetical protein